MFTRFPDAVPLVGQTLRRAAIGAVSLKEEAWWRKEWKGQRGVETFRSDAECRVLVLDAGQSAAGLTLTCATHVVFLDVLNSALLEDQAAARVARIGQTRPTTVWHLVAKDSADELLRDVAMRKTPLETGDDAPEAIGALLRAAAQRATAALALRADEEALGDGEHVAISSEGGSS